MKDVHCSPIQRMVFKKADYGDFNNNGTFDITAEIDRKCSILTNCQLKSHCGGSRSCELTIDNNLLPSQYCSDISKEIYTDYICVDTYISLNLKGEYSCQFVHGIAFLKKIKYLNSKTWKKSIVLTVQFYEFFHLLRQQIVLCHLQKKRQNVSL